MTEKSENYSWSVRVTTITMIQRSHHKQKTHAFSIFSICLLSLLSYCCEVLV